MLTCALYYVAKHPDVDDKLQEEIKKVLGEKNVDGSNIGDMMYVLLQHKVVYLLRNAQKDLFTLCGRRRLRSVCAFPLANFSLIYTHVT